MLLCTLWISDDSAAESLYSSSNNVLFAKVATGSVGGVQSLRSSFRASLISGCITCEVQHGAILSTSRAPDPIG